MFIRSKTVNGRKYYYLVKNERKGDKVVQKVVRYLGITKPSSSVVPNSENDKAAG